MKRDDNNFSHREDLALILLSNTTGSINRVMRILSSTTTMITVMHSVFILSANRFEEK